MPPSQGSCAANKDIKAQGLGLVQVVEGNTSEGETRGRRGEMSSGCPGALGACGEQLNLQAARTWTRTGAADPPPRWAARGTAKLIAL